MDSFDGITEFVAVAEKHGFSAAAKSLGCSSSHVSRQIARLEQRLGCNLVARTTRSVNLTKAGILYYQQCKDLVIGLQNANEQVMSQQYRLNGVLKVSAAGTFAEQHVIPALTDFAVEHPELKIEIDVNSRLVNFVEDGFDFVIRYGQLSDSGLVARKLVNRTMLAAASPDYLKRHGTPTKPDQLKKHTCIISNNAHWNFEIDKTVSSVKVDGKFQCNHAKAVVNACEKGLGIAYLPRSNFTQSIRQGTLVPILEPYWNTQISSWIVYQNRRFLPMRARLAIDYLLGYFSSWQE
ncbi:LysR family transcriptional regulator [Agaribacter flavus]|uniref:LysR family transcriptional regulator n=1 Tax=Agaribacter flavus TaxID=1902781 RepID=A0ABV7FRF2_9ALTE